MKNTMKWMAMAAAVAWLGAGCTDQNREGSAERARTGEDRNASASGAGERATAGEKTVTGRVVRASEDELVLKQQGQDEEVTLKLDASTPVLVDGREASASALVEGTEVRASYDDSHKATRIEAQQAPGSQSSRTGPAGAEGSSRPDTPSTSASGTGTSSVGNPDTGVRPESTRPDAPQQR